MPQPCQRPARRSASASDARRDAARISRNARSAVVSSSTPGVLHTAMPCARRGGDVDVVVADRDVGDDAAAAGAPAVEHVGVDRSVSRQTIASTLGRVRDELVVRERRVVGVGPTSSWPASTSGSSPPSGSRRVTEHAVAISPGLSARCSRPRPASFDADREAEAVDRRVVAHRAQAVHQVGRDVHEVALRDLALLAVDRHDPAARR